MFLTGLVSASIKGWGSRSLTENDAIEFCNQNSVHIIDDPKQPFGMLVKYKGYFFILVNPALDAGSRLWVLWHEIGHFILHEPTYQTFSKGGKRKCEREANVVAAIAMMPKMLLETSDVNDLLDLGIPRDLMRIRGTVLANENV